MSHGAAKRTCRGAGASARPPLAGPARTASMRFRLREARHPVCGGAGACGRGAQRGGCPRQPGRPAALQVRPWRAHGRSGTRAEGGQKRDRDRAWSARGRSRGAPTRGHNRVGAPARPRLRPGVQPARAAFLLRAYSCCRGWGGRCDAARAIKCLRLGDTASMQFRPREARQPVCALAWRLGWGTA